MELGVDVSKFAEGGKIVKDFQQFKTPLPPPRVPISTISKPLDEGTVSTTDTVEQVEGESVGGEAFGGEEISDINNPSMNPMVVLDVLPDNIFQTAQQEPVESTPQAEDMQMEDEYQVLDVVTPNVSLVKQIPGDKIMDWTNPTTQPGQAVSTAQHGQGVSTPQQIRTIQPVHKTQMSRSGVVNKPITRSIVKGMIASAAHSATSMRDLATGSPATFQTSKGHVSVRWGQQLKGVHQFFCFQCQHPFTTKADCLRHEESNCPLLKDEEKKNTIVRSVPANSPQNNI